MAGSRHGPALLELFESSGPRGSVRVTPPSSRAAERPAAAPPDAHPTAPTGGTAPGASVAQPLVRLDGGRATVSLTSTWAAMLLFVAGMLACGVYLIGFQRGRSFGHAEGLAATRKASEDEIARSRMAAADPRLSDGLRLTQTGDATRPAPAPVTNDPSIGRAAPMATDRAVAWVRGNNYVVVQGFQAGALDDAVTVQDYLARHGVQTQVVSKEDGGSWVITTQGFNLEDPVQKPLAEALKERVRSVGAAFRAAGGRYDLQSCYLMKLKGDRW